LCYFAIHTFGRRLMYPGTLWLLQMGVWPSLLDGRSKLVEERYGKRYKLKTSQNNSVDCMFVDRRNDRHYPNGNILVIACEGNAGYYEIGSMITPLDAGYSVLGWNHPGFGGSTGVPLPEQECGAVDVVMQFAINRLGFAEEDVAIFAWSIGGYSAAWLGMNYRNLRALILDATFDDVLPLADRVLPKSWSPLVEQTIRTYANLNVVDQLKNYDGPVLFYRRTRDEILSTDDSNPEAQKRSNRANFLLKLFLTYRYPNVFDVESLSLVDEWLQKTTEDRLKNINYDEEFCSDILEKYFSNTTDGVHFPSDIGDDFDRNRKNNLALFLTSRHLIDFDSTHCVPLPKELFKIPFHPWDLLID